MKTFTQIINSLEIRNPQQTFEGLLANHLVSEPASEGEIETLERRIGKKVPTILRELYQVSNGLALFAYEDIGGFKFFSLKELENWNNLYSENIEALTSPKWLIFGESIADGEYYGFCPPKSDHSVYEIILENPEAEWQVIANSLPEFIAKIIEERGRKYWL